MTLITPYEVINYGPVAESFPVKYVCDQIFVTEAEFFQDCLGDDLYEAMLADVQSIVGIADYNIQDTYSEDDEVVYEGCVFVSLENGNTKDPDNVNSWRVRDKFGSECFQSLWDRYLKQLLSFSVILSSVRYATFQAGGHGIMEMIDDQSGSRTVSAKAFDGYERKLDTDIAVRKKLIMKYLSRETNKVCFSGYEIYKANCKGSCDIAPRKRRIYLKY